MVVSNNVLIFLRNINICPNKHTVCYYLQLNIFDSSAKIIKMSIDLAYSDLSL